MLPVCTLKLYFMKFHFTVYVAFFADKRLKMKLLIDTHVYALHYAEFYKMHRFAYLNIVHCVELPFLEGKLGRFLMLVFFNLIAFGK